MNKVHFFVTAFLIMNNTVHLQAEINRDEIIDFNKLEMDTKLLKG